MELIAPQKCLLCGERDQLLCGHCLPALTPSIQTVSGFPLHIAVSRRDFAQVVVVWKDQRTKKLTDELATLAVAALPLDMRGVIAPIPSRKGSLIRRGWEPVLTLAVQISQRTNWEVCPGLFRWKREPDEQRLLSDAQRRLNVENRIECSHTPSQPVWIVDDVMTTGSSLLAAARALENQGVQVAGFLVLTAPRRTS
jgi:predicted amidophosphoribosyltransferase